MAGVSAITNNKFSIFDFQLNLEKFVKERAGLFVPDDSLKATHSQGTGLRFTRSRSLKSLGLPRLARFGAGRQQKKAIKPHDRLVPVSYTPRGACTSGLSTR